MIGEIRVGRPLKLRLERQRAFAVSTIHTNDSASIISRLMDMDIDPFLISTSVVGIISPAVIRTTAPDEGEKYVLLHSELICYAQEEIKSHYIEEKDAMYVITLISVDRCVYELMPISYQIRQLINRRESTDVTENRR